MRRVLIAVAGVGVTAMAAAGFGLKSVGAAPDPATPAYYTEQVRPIFVKECGKCHLTVNHKGGLSLETKASTMKGGRDGVVIVPGDPSKSALVKLIRHEGPADDPKPMPPKSPKISDAEIAVITQWIKAGAVMPNDPPQ
ncbi:MAG TPA: c-type cytochrome domain-containing protein [Acidobacteriaceae bacterium]|nr:c-type cytochrome domain-containing protein [Acidobacteriaceae bacterium]